MDACSGLRYQAASEEGISDVWPWHPHPDDLSPMRAAYG